MIQSRVTPLHGSSSTSDLEQVYQIATGRAAPAGAAGQTQPCRTFVF
jgi:hypothetical protein